MFRISSVTMVTIDSITNKGWLWDGAEQSSDKLLSPPVSSAFFFFFKNNIIYLLWPLVPHSVNAPLDEKYVAVSYRSICIVHSTSPAALRPSVRARKPSLHKHFPCYCFQNGIFQKMSHNILGTLGNFRHNLICSPTSKYSRLIPRLNMIKTWFISRN